MATVIIFYYLFFLPAAFEGMVNYQASVKFYINKICNFLFFANALINPLIYAGHSTEINAAYRSMLGLKPTSGIILTQETLVHHISVQPAGHLH